MLSLGIHLIFDSVLISQKMAKWLLGLPSSLPQTRVGTISHAAPEINLLRTLYPSSHWTTPKDRAAYFHYRFPFATESWPLYPFAFSSRWSIVVRFY